MVSQEWGMSYTGQSIHYITTFYITVWEVIFLSVILTKNLSKNCTELFNIWNFSITSIHPNHSIITNLIIITTITFCFLTIMLTLFVLCPLRCLSHKAHFVIFPFEARVSERVVQPGRCHQLLATGPAGLFFEPECGKLHAKSFSSVAVALSGKENWNSARSECFDSRHWNRRYVMYFT